ncbi:MAG: divergent polysaccharide deacetylase family protein [gamma proteobacterium symbiont of Lucinoma myriamae]|nr:divergent polysaccharide deacetylase family protein [gamma proteobacterium symbiont of Lucinoma myriamae]MCU7818903.1 divergent polysaccharide deacetylase family protein [gamma proteobacterium symbiont of Lucinoma myriamae]MCU7832430.1 divergent polysaccharide deacetylase family protein [gamma proteobacterium symbiont of Lucinoma myriamae]
MLILLSSLSAFLLAMLLATTSWAVDEPGNVPTKGYIAIIIDDLGYKYKHDQRAINLPGQVTFAFLPHTPYVKSLAETVHSHGKDIMLHLPMQALMETFYLGPGALTSDMTEQEFKQSLLDSIRSIPYLKGVNNHMGSLITSQSNSMQWLMDELVKTDLYFVDSRTTVKTVAEQTANQYQIKNTRRNVFLDHELNRPAIEFQFKRLINLAKKNGSAVAIGHPFPETLDVLEEYIPQLKAAGIQLLPVSQLIQQQKLIAQAKQKNKWNNSKSLTQSGSSVHLKKSIN